MSRSRRPFLIDNNRRMLRTRPGIPQSSGVDLTALPVPRPVAGLLSLFFFFNDPPPPEFYPLPLPDALPLSAAVPPTWTYGPTSPSRGEAMTIATELPAEPVEEIRPASTVYPWFVVLFLMVLLTSSLDRKSTRLNSSHSQISYAVFCLKKKKT